MAGFNPLSVREVNGYTVLSASILQHCDGLTDGYLVLLCGNGGNGDAEYVVSLLPVDASEWVAAEYSYSRKDAYETYLSRLVNEHYWRGTIRHKTYRVGH